MNDESIHVLFVINRCHNFITHRLPLIKKLLEDGYKVSVVAPKDICYQQLQELALDIAIYGIDLDRKSLNVFREFKTFLQIYKHIRKLKPDIITSVAIKASLYTSLSLCFQKKIKNINLFTGLGPVFEDKRARFRILRACLELGMLITFRIAKSIVIVQNEESKQILLSHHIISKSRITVIKGSGVDTQLVLAQPEPEGIITIVLPARMLIDKGVYEFVEAAKIIHANNIPAHFILAGDMDQDNRATITTQQLQLWQQEGVVEWIGWQDNIIPTLLASHIVCLPSYHEGLPKVLLEGATCGRALVATDVSGCREVVQDNYNGYLVQAKCPQSLANALQKLIGNYQLRLTMGQRSRELVEKYFSLDVILKQFMNLYKEGNKAC